MIVKNEQNNIGRCLKAISYFVNEIVIVDTGSTDNTKKIAQEYTNMVFDFEWCNDFSKARNFSIEKASNDWILVLDADEFLVDFDAESIKVIYDDPMIIGKIKIINHFDDLNDAKKSMEKVGRIFNRNFYKYEGIIHEQLVPMKECNYRYKLVELEVKHIGYTDEIIKSTNKHYRNIKLLNYSLDFKGKDPYIYYQLGKSYYMLKDYGNAVSAFEDALEFDIDIKLEYVEDLVETYGYALLNNKLYSDALKILNIIDNFEDSCDFSFLIALIYMNNGFMCEAIQYFKKCLTYKKCKVDGVNSFRTYYNLGVIYECNGDLQNAKCYYKKCGSFNKADNRLKIIKDLI